MALSPVMMKFYTLFHNISGREWQIQLCSVVSREVKVSGFVSCPDEVLELCFIPLGAENGRYSLAPRSAGRGGR